MFHFPAFPPHTLCVQVRVTPHNWCRVSPFGHPGITARLTAPPGLSRPPTSFIGSWCQGIHRLPSATSQQRCSRPLCNSQTTTNPTPTNHHTPQPGQFDDPSRAGYQDNKQPPHQGARLFPQDPTGCLTATTSRTTDPIHTPTPTPRRGPTREQYESRRPLPATASPVSPPMSTPPTHPADAGSWTTFAARCSLERR
jgi:hypothetical protein